MPGGLLSHFENTKFSHAPWHMQHSRYVIASSPYQCGSESDGMRRMIKMIEGNQYIIGEIKCLKCGFVLQLYADPFQYYIKKHRHNFGA